MLMFIIPLILSSIMFMFLKHPLSCGLILLIQTLLTSLMTGLMSLNYWYSYILLLIMVGGMLILFIYMTSIASNEKFKFSPKLTMMILLLTMLTSLLFLIDPYYMNEFNQIIELKPQETQPHENISFSKYLNFPNSMLMTLMILYLLLALIAIVKIINLSYGSLRHKF
uniref:NADH-ubiquinone oxidoreductase chain 6 n=1 Tax=Fleutiauxia armata TaxID=1205662 RepID=A0A0S2MQG7_9CUCU|nr:NADH deshydrogenase subunit 6 [Fleutiauxia armata]